MNKVKSKKIKNVLNLEKKVDIKAVYFWEKVVKKNKNYVVEKELCLIDKKPSQIDGASNYKVYSFNNNKITYLTNYYDINFKCNFHQRFSDLKNIITEKQLMSFNEKEIFVKDLVEIQSQINNYFYSIMEKEKSKDIDNNLLSL